MHTHTHKEILLCRIKNEIVPFMTAWIVLEDIMLREECQTKTNII